MSSAKAEIIRLSLEEMFAVKTECRRESRILPCGIPADGVGRLFKISEIN